MGDISLPAGFDHGHIDDTKAAIGELRGRAANFDNQFKVLEASVHSMNTTYSENFTTIAAEFSSLREEFDASKVELAKVNDTLAKLHDVIQSSLSTPAPSAPLTPTKAYTTSTLSTTPDPSAPETSDGTTTIHTS